MKWLIKIKELYPNFRIDINSISMSIFVNKDYPLFQYALHDNDFDKGFEDIYNRIVSYKEKFYNKD